jgi:translation initiation factor 1 (eIF-1/SUI1)
VRSVDARKMAEAIRGQNKIVEQTEEPEPIEQTEQPEPQEEPEEPTETIVKIRVPKRTNRKLVIKKPKSSN